MTTKIKPKPKKEYWTKVEEEAVKEYLLLEPESPKSEYIFEHKIYEPLKKLIENIMFTYHLAIPELSVEEQVLDTMGFVVSKMRKFEPDKGHKSFSYYGTIAKNYMIMKKNKAYNKKITTVDIMDVLGFEWENSLYTDNEFEQDFNSHTFLFTIIADDLDNLIKTDLTLEPNVYKLSEVIVYLLRNYQNINIQNKRQFYFIAREFTGMSAKEITKTMKRIREAYANSCNFFH